MRIVCISRDDRPERREHIRSQDWGNGVEFMDAVKSDGFARKAVDACCRSHLLALKSHLHRFPTEPLLLIEDDAEIVDLNLFRECLKNPDVGCSSLGSRVLTDGQFVHTHAMLVNGMTERQLLAFEEAIGRGNAENCYLTAFGTVAQVQPIAVDFAPFYSDRRKSIQSPIRSGSRVDKPFIFPWDQIKPTHIPQAYTHCNLGDDIQTLAAMELWGVESTVDRDDPASWPIGTVIPLIGWWEDVELSKSKAEVKIVGFHCTRQFSTSIEKHKKFLLDSVHAQGFPAMCRDMFTRDVLRAIGIPAEFGGCVTLTLSRPKVEPTCNTLSVDGRNGDESVSNLIRDLPDMHPSQRLELAKDRINQINGAAKVVTKRLHAWLPALALGVEAHFLNTHYSPERFDGYNTTATSIKELYDPLH